MVSGSREHCPGGLLAIVVVCAVTLAVGALGLRLSRTTSDFYVAGRTVSPVQRQRPSAASTSPPQASSASPVWSTPGASTCCGSRSATPSATLSCWCSSPRRCGARAPTRSRLRRGAPRSPDAIRLSSSVLVVGIGWLYLLPQFQGAEHRPQPRHRRASVRGQPRRRGRRPGQRRGRRDAVDHPGPGDAVLAQAHRDRRARLRPAGPVVAARRAAPKSTSPAALLGTRSAASAATTTRSTRRTARSSRSSSAPWACRTSWCASTPTPTAGPPAAPRWPWSPCSGCSTSSRRSTASSAGSTCQPSRGKPPDSIVPAPAHRCPAGPGSVLSAALAGGAFAAFLSTASGLTISVAGVIDQDLLRGRAESPARTRPWCRASGSPPCLAMAVPYAAARVVEPIVARDHGGARVRRGRLHVLPAARPRVLVAAA